MRKTSFVGSLLWAFLILNGCAVISPPPTIMPPPPAAVVQQMWQSRQAALSCADTFTVIGRLAVAFREDGSTARVSWQQQAADFNIRLSGPIGIGGVELQGQSDSLRITRGRETKIYLEPPETAVARELGYPLPIAGLRYWVLGLPRSAQDYQSLDLDAWGRPLRLEQDGWRIEYQEYASADALALPRRIALSRPDLQIKWLAEDWRLLHTNQCPHTPPQVSHDP